MAELIDYQSIVACITMTDFRDGYTFATYKI